MNVFQRLLLISCTSLLISTVFADHHANTDLNVDRAGTSILDLFDNTPAAERVIPEETFSLPATTQYAQWAAFDSSLASSSNRFYLALDSLTQGETDRIWRYAVKIVTRQGVENIRFEGLHCEHKLYRTYAFGNVDGTWITATNVTWRHIVRNAHNDYPAALFDAFCRTSGAPRIEKIKQHFNTGGNDNLAPS